MGSDNIVIETLATIGFENGAFEQLRSTGGENLILEKVNMTVNGSTESLLQLEERGTANSLVGRVGDISTFHEDINGSPLSEESSEEVMYCRTEPVPHKVQSKSKKEKPSNPKHVSAALVKKNKDGKDKDAKNAASTGANSGQAVERNRIIDPIKPKKLATTPITTLHLQQSGRLKVSQSKGLKEHVKNLKPLNQAPENKTEESAHSASLSPIAGDLKPHRVGNMPSYGFSFKCDERAEKRKEFYTKLEEKIHAKEVEKTTLQEKSKETQEAELKLLRKKLTFKATPMPNFYQEPTPSKVELKKVPPTRAKSPKLGRQNNSSVTNSEGNRSRSSRLSLDVKVSRDSPSKGTNAQHAKKPLRKSLPKLPSEISTLPNPIGDITSTQQLEHQKLYQEMAMVTEPSETKLNQDGAPVAEPSQTELNHDNAPVTELSQIELNHNQSPLAAPSQIELNHDGASSLSEAQVGLCE